MLGEKKNMNHRFGNGVFIPIYGDLGDGVLIGLATLTFISISVITSIILWLGVIVILLMWYSSDHDQRMIITTLSLHDKTSNYY